MNKGRIKAVLFLLLFLLVMALSVKLLLDMELQKKAELVKLPVESAAPAQTAPQETPAPAQTDASAGTAPQPTPEPAPEPTALPSPEPTPEPTPVPTPESTPVPTPEPTAVPIPAGEVLGSGMFQSETGVALNLRALWTARVLDADRVAVTVEVYLDSYSLQITAAPKSLHVSVGDSFASADTPTVNQEENVKIETLLGTTEHVLPLADGQSARFPVQVEYAFGGTYQKLELPVIECGGGIELTR